MYGISKLPISKLISGDYWDFPSHPFLTHIIIKFWSKFSIEETWLRLPSMIASVLSIIGIFLLGYELYKSKRASLISAFLFAYSTYNIKFSGEAKFYSILLLFEIFSLLFFVRIINTLNNKRLKILDYGLFLGFSFLSLITDYSFLWLFLIYILYVSTLFIRYTIKPKFIYLRKIVYLFITLVLIPLLFFPWLPKFLYSLNEAIAYRYYVSRPTIYDLVETISAFTTFFKHKYAISVPASGWWDNIQTFFRLNSDSSKFIYFFFHYLFFLFLLIILLRAILKVRNNPKILLLLKIIFIPLTLSFFISQKFPIFMHYNLMIIQIGLIFVISKYVSDHQKSGIVILMLYILLNSLGINLLLRNGTIQDWRGISRYINSRNLEKDSAIIVSPSFYISSLNYYNEKNKIIPLYTVIGINNPKIIINPLDQHILYTLKYSRLCFAYDIDSPNNSSELTRNIADFLVKNYPFKNRAVFMRIYVDCFVRPM